MTSELTQHEKNILHSMKNFGKYDKGSQNRLRKIVNDLRETSKAFSESFDKSLTDAGFPEVKELNKKKLDLKNKILHPIESAKEVVAKKGLEMRNKAPEILRVPNPILKKISEPIDLEKTDKKELLKIVRQMGAALREAGYGDRLGIAAPQIGINKRIFVSQGAVCINPEMKPPNYDVTIDSIEGCYSVPHELYKVKRHRVIYAKWYSIDGILREFKLTGKNAIVFQHELDHLDGKCCCDVGVKINQ